MVSDSFVESAAHSGSARGRREKVARTPCFARPRADTSSSPLTLAVPTRTASTHPSESPSPPSRRSPGSRSPLSPVPPSPSTYRHNPDDPDSRTKDLSFLLHSSFYLPIPQHEVPPQFRVQFRTVSASTPTSELLAELDGHLSRADFLSAAHLSGQILTSPMLDPTDVNTIADLLSTRYSCLELSGNALMAAQESKVLEDLNSEFYYILPATEAGRTSKTEVSSLPPKHILPLPLRVQASRLQSIGFSDPRRGVAVIYDLGLECREYLSSQSLSSSERELWSQRLAELGIRVVNALIEIGDLDCARRTLKTLPPTHDSNWKLRLGLLSLKIGDVSTASELLKLSDPPEMLRPLVATTEGRYQDAIKDWEELLEMDDKHPLKPVMQQNLAVNMLYAGRLQDARALMEEIVASGESHGSLTFNLATVYELGSDRARDLKVGLVKKVASQNGEKLEGQTKLNADFKL